jgi:hypothetical protein
MSFFNSLSIRIPLVLLGGFLYSFLTDSITLLLGLSSELAVFAALVVFLFYLTSRFLLLFSGVNTLYYSKAKKTGSTQLYENTSFYKTARWVGTFYHYHDIVLFICLILLAIFFLITLGVDGWSGMPFGKTAQDLWSSLIPMP